MTEPAVPPPFGVHPPFRAPTAPRGCEPSCDRAAPPLPLTAPAAGRCTHAAATARAWRRVRVRVGVRARVRVSVRVRG